MQLLTEVMYQALPEGNWFCCSDCDEVHAALVNLVAGGEENIPDSLLSLIKRKHEEKGLETGAGLDIKWRVLSWKLIASDKTRQLLSKAVAILHVSILRSLLYLFIYFNLVPLLYNEIRN